MSATNQTYSLTYDLPIETTQDDYELLTRIFDTATVVGECWEAAGRPNKHSGYVHLTLKNAYDIRYIHRFICHLFHGLPLNYRTHQCHHLCGNKTCCRPSHLRSISVTDHHSVTHASGQYLRGDQTSWSVLTEAQVVDYRKRYAAGEKCPALAKEAGVKKSTLYNAIHGKTFSGVPGALKPNGRRDSKGERQPSSKLKESHILPIYNAYWTGQKNTIELGAIYGISDETVRSIIHGKSWKHVKRPTLERAA